MTTLIPFDFRHAFENLKDKESLQLVHRMVKAELVFHESRLAQLNEVADAVQDRINRLG